MIDKATAICDEEFLAAELEHIKSTFLYNGYPPGLISSVIRQRTTRPEVVLPSHNLPLLVLPYYKSLGEKIRRMGKEIGFKTFFESSSTLRAMVRHDKIRLPPEDKQMLFTRFCAVVPPPISEKRTTACLKGLANTSAALTITRMRFLTSKEKKQNAGEGLGKETPTQRQTKQLRHRP
ncbi:hypothetical protein M514_27341 [Trichuris suis]|uniref:Helix-turn-helix domain-containing protein n=1 Tax=Trichuris suis TaxID=68888 RepID=A0A085MTF9_9BILA|nr:hypothetical protein M514_27341 [Trichuris suis]